MFAPDPWNSVCPTVTATWRRVRFVNRVGAGACTILCFGAGVRGAVVICFLGARDGAACDRVRFAIGWVLWCSCGVLGRCVVVSRGWCISGGVCCTVADTASLRLIRALGAQTFFNIPASSTEVRVSSGWGSLGRARTSWLVLCGTLRYLAGTNFAVLCTLRERGLSGCLDGGFELAILRIFRENTTFLVPFEVVEEVKFIPQFN